LDRIVAYILRFQEELFSGCFMHAWSFFLVKHLLNQQ
jgi:hypothetical protein